MTHPPARLRRRHELQRRAGAQIPVRAGALTAPLEPDETAAEPLQRTGVAADRQGNFAVRSASQGRALAPDGRVEFIAGRVEDDADDGLLVDCERERDGRAGEAVDEVERAVDRIADERWSVAQLLARLERLLAQEVKVWVVPLQGGLDHVLDRAVRRRHLVARVALNLRQTRWLARRLEHHVPRHFGNFNQPLVNLFQIDVYWNQTAVIGRSCSVRGKRIDAYRSHLFLINIYGDSINPRNIYLYINEENCIISLMIWNR